MLDAVKEIGEMAIKAENKSLLDVLVKKPTSKKNCYIFSIKIAIENKNFTYDGINIEKYDSSKIYKYLFVNSSGNGPGYTPIANLNRNNIDTTFKIKIENWYRNIIKNKIISNENIKNYFKKVHEVLMKEENLIIEDIKKEEKDILKKDQIILTIIFKVNDINRYIGEIPIYKYIVLEYDNKKFKVFSENHVCSICGKIKRVVFGDINTYKFYTIDKVGYITSGFNKKYAWKNFPICTECRLALEEGKKYIESNLSFKFLDFRYNYLLIPKFIFGENNIKEDVLDIFINTNKLISLKNITKKRILSDEEEIFEYLKDFNDVFTLNFLFIQKQNSAERILLLIEDVFPSHLREIFSAKDSVEKMFGDNFTFRNIRNFLSKSDINKRDSDLDGYFLDITDRIFRGRKVDLNLLLKFIMKRVRDEFIEDRYYASATKDGIMAVTFLEKLGLIEMEVHEMEERQLSDFFKKYDKNFETPLKRGLVLLGALTELLLRKQYKDRGAKPFMKNLKSLKMDEKDIKGLLPKVQNKLEEYDSFDKGKRLLAKEVSNYLLLAGDNWHMPVDEINFYFACGINLTDEIAAIIYNKEEELQ